MDDIIDLAVGFDQREAVAYHTFVQSVIENASIPVRFMPLDIKSLKTYNETHTDGSNDFIYSRFLVPHLMNFKGWAIYADGDMICVEDIKKLWDLKDEKYAVQVVQHNYKTKVTKKYWGNKNENYPRKNWSSVVIWNCGHDKHKILSPNFIQNQTGSFLHRFHWLNDDEIGSIDNKWNWLAMEYEEKKEVNLIHYTIGTPCFREYSNKSFSSYWNKSFSNLLDSHYKKENLG